MLNQVDLEQLARQMRARGLRSSWIELMEFSQSVVGNLVDAYQVLLINSVPSSDTLSVNSGDFQAFLQGKLGKALVTLTSQEQVDKWKAEALAGNIPDIPGTISKPCGI